MASQPGGHPEPAQTDPRARINRAVRAVRSGIRRYPRAIYDSIRTECGGTSVPDLPKAMHQLWPHDLAVMWLGHGSVAAQIHDVTMVVDPVLSERIGMRMGRRTIGIPRLAPPPLAPESLRGIDLLLITHAHFDHLDRPTLQRMISPDTRVVVPRRCRRLIPSGFGEVVELGIDQTLKHNGLTITAMRPEHWGARNVLDRRRGVNAYHIESDTQRALFTGDTAHTTVFDPLEQVDLAVFGIGAYNPWEHMHATPEQVWAMFQRIGARYLLPVHHSTFELSDEPMHEPVARLAAAAGQIGDDSILRASPGEVIVINPGDPHEELGHDQLEGAASDIQPSNRSRK